MSWPYRFRCCAMLVVWGCLHSAAPDGTAFAARNAQVGSAGQNVPPLIRQMVGTWDVQQRMWPGPGAAPVNLSPAIAKRRLVNGVFLEEMMEPARKTDKDPFTRTAFFNYNAVSKQYEYFSLDSRAPQMMSEKGREGGR